ncbi:MAG: isocitrate lyase/PEP mutase family protein [Deltaproteobacteria bacterium]|nr:isocitrate lyase/PEP mutase family protein [Deltaproteobacteria bacterium]
MGNKICGVYRKLLESGGPRFTVIGALPIHALIAQESGADSFILSCADTALYLLGSPDARLVTMNELVENAQRTCDATDLPVIVDCGTGFGERVNVRRTAEALIRAGAAGLFLGDQVNARGSESERETLPLDEAIGKYRAAIDACNKIDSDFVIMARRAAGGRLDETTDRCKAYKDSGVSAVWLEDLESREDVRQARLSIGSPLLVSTGGISPPLSDEDLRDLDVIDAGIEVSQVGMIAVWELLLSIKERGLDAWSEFIQLKEDHPLAGFGEFELLGFPKIREWEEKYLSPDQMRKYERSLGLYEPGRESRVNKVR